MATNQRFVAGVECINHVDCQDPAVKVMDDDSIGNYKEEDDIATRWCNINYQCNRCSSWGCATDDYIVNWIPSIDGTCPSGCCGWGVSKEPYWTYDSPSFVAPCDANNFTTIVAYYLVNAPQNRQPTIDEFLTNGKECTMWERIYWEQAPLQAGSNQTSTAIDDWLFIDRLPHKAAVVDCHRVKSLSCYFYPVAVALMIKQNGDGRYEYITDPVNVQTGSRCEVTYGLPPKVKVFFITLATLAVVGGLLLWKMGACKNTDRGRHALEDNATNIVTTPTGPNIVTTTTASSSITTSFPVSRNDATTDPNSSLPMARPLESAVVNTIMRPSPKPERQVQSPTNAENDDDEA